jgi:dipeptidyl aminopeptidase/acylaminoacyl peptidase
MEHPMFAVTVVFALVSVPVALYLAAGAVVAHMLTRAKRKSPYAEPAWDGYKNDRVNFASRGGRLQLAGWYLPATRSTRVVVLVHGKDSCRGDEFKASSHVLVQALRARGLGVFLLDLRGHGESAAARVTYGVRERDDVLGAVDWLMDRGYLPGAIGLLGASMGGACAVAAARCELAVGAVVVDSTFADFNDMMQRKFRKLSGLPNLFLPVSLLFAWLYTGLNFAQYRPADDMQQLAGRPLLVIHTDGDPFVPCDHARQLAQAGGGHHWFTSGDHHLDSFRRFPEQYQLRVGNFFEQHLVCSALRRA